MTIIPLSEGLFTVDASKQFIPAAQNTADTATQKSGSLSVQIQPFVVITAKDVILLDTGLGLVNSAGQFQLYKNLKQHGITPDDVTKVILSHLHKDHIGGLVNPFTKQLSFERAAHYVQQQELSYAYEKGAPSYVLENVELLKNASNLQLLNQNAGYINPFIQYEMTGAHSPFHQVIKIEEDGKTAFFGGDDAPQYKQMQHRFAAKYDYDGKKAMELRAAWWKEGKDKNWCFLFYHDTHYPTYCHQ